MVCHQSHFAFRSRTTPLFSLISLSYLVLSASQQTSIYITSSSSTLLPITHDIAVVQAANCQPLRRCHKPKKGLFPISMLTRLSLFSILASKLQQTSMSIKKEVCLNFTSFHFNHLPHQGLHWSTLLFIILLTAKSSSLSFHLSYTGCQDQTHTLLPPKFYFFIFQCLGLSPIQ